MCKVERFPGTCFQARKYVVDVLGLFAILLVCANAGQPGGGTNNAGKFVVPKKKPQEEEVFCEIDERKGRSFVENVLFRLWGLLGDGKTITHQGIDYTTCPMSDYSLVLASFRAGDTHYIFVAAPNASTGGRVGGSMQRTASTAARDDYYVFREGVKFAVMGFLLGCIGLDAVPIVTMIGCGIYAGQEHKKHINEEFYTIVEEVLRMLYNGVPIGSNFGLVLVPEGKDAKTSNDRATCEYGSKCTRKNPAHIAQYHPVSNACFALPQARPAGVSEESSVCVYGSNCTRINPDHIMRCHAAPMQSTAQRVTNGAVCEYGKGCYRTSQVHVDECHQGVPPRMRNSQRRFEEKVHPHGDRSYTTAAPMQSAAQRMFNRDVCEYGEGCYQTNTEHVATYHQGRTPASRGVVRASTVARCKYGDSCWHVLSGNMGHIETQHPDIYSWLRKNPNKNLTSYPGF